MKPAIVREEISADYAAIRSVNEAAFGRSNEGRLIDRLREDGLIVASLVAVSNERVVGNVVFSDLPISTPAGEIDATALAPIAVLPEHHGHGVGRALIEKGLRICKDRGKRAVLVLGDPAYYTRFGFSSILSERIKSPYTGPSWMAIELIDGVLEGVEGRVTYPDAFEEVD